MIVRRLLSLFGCLGVALLLIAGNAPAVGAHAATSSSTFSPLTVSEQTVSFGQETAFLATGNPSTETVAKREGFLCVANGITMAALGGGASVLAVKATRAVVLARAAFMARRAINEARALEITAGAAASAADLQVKGSSLIPSIATAFITTCAGGFTLFFYKDLATKIFPDDSPTSETDGATFVNNLIQDPQIACTDVPGTTIDPVTALCYDGNQYYTPGGQLVGSTICAKTPGTNFDSVSQAYCTDGNGNYFSPDGTKIGSCVTGFPTGAGLCTDGQNNTYNPDGTKLGNPALNPPIDACMTYLADGSGASDCDGLLTLAPADKTTPPAPYTVNGQWRIDTYFPVHFRGYLFLGPQGGVGMGYIEDNGNVGGQGTLRCTSISNGIDCYETWYYSDSNWTTPSSYHFTYNLSSDGMSLGRDDGRTWQRVIAA